MKNKKLLIILVLLMFVTLLTGCSAGPGKIVQKFLYAVNDGEIEEAMSYLSTSTLQTLSTEKWRAGLVQASNQMTDEGGLQKVEILDESVNGEIAKVTFVVTIGGSQRESESIDLVKEDGDWKIRLDPYSK